MHKPSVVGTIISVLVVGGILGFAPQSVGQTGTLCKQYGPFANGLIQCLAKAPAANGSLTMVCDCPCPPADGVMQLFVQGNVGPGATGQYHCAADMAWLECTVSAKYNGSCRPPAHRVIREGTERETGTCTADATEVPRPGESWVICSLTPPP
jgi:hypothetical protein